ncbi:hypothetical protein GCM10028805_35020 [Spirosoma harenae]
MNRFAFTGFYLILSVCFSLCPDKATAQSKAKFDKVYTVAEVQPEYPGGAAALSSYLAATVKIPGSLARNQYNTGPVAAKFIIDDLGYIHDIRIQTKPLDKKMRKGMQAYMANIIASIEKMPRWTPGQVGGKPVPVFYTLPIEVSMQ